MCTSRKLSYYIPFSVNIHNHVNIYMVYLFHLLRLHIITLLSFEVRTWHSCALIYVIYRNKATHRIHSLALMLLVKFKSIELLAYRLLQNAPSRVKHDDFMFTQRDIPVTDNVTHILKKNMPPICILKTPSTVNILSPTQDMMDYKYSLYLDC